MRFCYVVVIVINIFPQRNGTDRAQELLVQIKVPKYKQPSHYFGKLLMNDMVIASNKWLSNSGDDQKSSEVVASSNNEPAKANTATTDLLKSNLMSAGAADTSGAELTTGTSQALALETDIVDNANQNEGNSLSLEEQLKEPEKPFDNILKAMASNKNEEDYVMNEETMFQDELETARTTIASSGNMEEYKELENNNHAYTTLIDATFNNMIAAGLDSDPTDSNINMLNNDLSVKSSNTMKTLVADDNIGSLNSISNKEDRSSFLNTLTIGSNIQNTNSPQTIVMNNANAMSNKPVNPVYALDTARPSVLNVGNNSSNKNSHIINGDGSTTISNGQAKIVLYCEQSSHPFQTRTILLTPYIECKVGRLIAKCKASESNAIFDCKVLSRNHAVLWYSDDGKFWVKDTKSSNGTFINDNKLGNDAAELHYGDIVKFGVDVLENSRKEVHGCIIASVKLYLPDGRQAISIDSNSQRSQYSGESRISFDELHRLNVYMQETSQREKALKSKLYNIQNLLDATRKNSSTCWQAMISEDQLLHRIHSLEKKIQILEKNMPESALKNEILKLIDDKSAYQHSAKEALRSVYLERCEAMQKLAKLESEFTTSQNECKILRDQITCTEEAFQDASERLRLLETESNEYRSEAERQQIEAKMEFEERNRELAEKLQQREDECESLRIRIAEFSQQKSTEPHGDEDKLQKQAIENLDAVIAGMDLGDDDDEDEEYVIEEDVAEGLRQQNKEGSKSGEIYDFNGSSDSSGNEKQGNFKLKTSGNQIIGGEATIMKWLKNSDLNMKEGSMDIFNAICNNESDSSDENDVNSPGAVAITGKDLKQRCSNLEKKLQNLGQHIKQLEGDIKEYPVNKKPVMNIDASNDIKSESESVSLEELNDQMSKDQHSIQLKKTVFTVHEAFEEIFDNFKQLRADVMLKQKQSQHTSKSQALTTTKATQFQKINSITNSNTNVTLPEIDEVDDEHDSEEDDENEDIDILATGRRVFRLKQLPKQSTVVNIEEKLNPTEAAFLAEIEDLKTKFSARDRDSQQMLEMLQIECETHKMKVNELLKLTDTLRENQESEENQVNTNDMSQHELKLPTVIDDFGGDGVSSDSGVSNVDKTTETATQIVTDASVNTSMGGSISDVENSAVSTAAAFERQMREELATINSSAVQREEELIAYKESLEQFQKENLKLRNDLLQMQKQPEDINNAVFMRTIIPMGIAAVGVLAYLIITYF